jgi:phage virion morphogenesis protein
MSIEIDDTELKAAFARMRMLGAEPRVWLTPVGAAIKESIRLRFIDSVAPDGSKWKPLKYRKGQPLVDTGQHLKNAISYRVDANSVTIGVPYPWAVIHQYGSAIQRKELMKRVFKIGPASELLRKGHKPANIPARPFFGINSEDRKEIENLVGSMISAAAGGTTSKP